ncbi:hypothetical protein BZA77DRAFT_359893 [Pyronema omphalodes]|nr:hypothetical protein BZA77DRAFT_359893 [Pyronema omphalodes]
MSSMSIRNGTSKSSDSSSVYRVPREQQATHATFQEGRIILLTEYNYREWSQACRHLLGSMGLWEIVQRREPPLEDSVYLKRKGQAQWIIYASCSIPIRAFLDGENEPAKMWQILKDNLDPVMTRHGRHYLAKEFDESSPKPQESPKMYAARLRVFQNQLSGTQEQISDADIKTKMRKWFPSHTQYM